MKNTSKNNDVRLGLGRNIRELRKRGGFSQYQFARMVSMDRSYLIGIEKGEKNVSIDMLSRIATGLGVQVKDLFPLTEQGKDALGPKGPEDVEYQSHIG